MSFPKDFFFNCEEKKCIRSSKDGKKKRPERKLYIPPALRSKCEEKDDWMEYTNDNFPNEVFNRQTRKNQLLKNQESSRRITNIIQWRERFDSFSSSSNPRNTSDESGRDDDSSDFEDCCSVPIEAMSDLSIGTDENTSNDGWNMDRSGESTQSNDEIENHQFNAEISNRILMKREDYSEVKSHTNRLNSELNETTSDRGFFNYDDGSISDIEAVIDSYIKKGRVLTSTPDSDIVEEKILDAAKYAPEEESGIESTLLGQSKTTIITNGNKRDYNSKIHCDPPSLKRQPPEFLEVFGENYILPPAPPSSSGFLLPPIHRLSSPVSSTHELPVLRHIPPQKMPQMLPQSRNPRLEFPPSLQLYSDAQLSSSNSSYTPPVPRSSPCLQPTRPRAPNPPRVPFSAQSRLLPRERFNAPRSSRDVSNPLNLHPRSVKPRSLELNKQDAASYIPPVPRPQKMDGNQQIRNSNQSRNVESCFVSEFIGK